ncbi:hypothetical protein [Chamaesiphon sp. OTE_20_metabat_361]|uniref:hypothetical protein n=1 Tax=Chamaesiphon sp. OTE_20_metabat_361 TaxID=2964689 RepID=UPI00286AA0C5|nr:hypothetical protein [Chamaesiphon sp. OTE_20_metabat_361]
MKYTLIFSTKLERSDLNIFYDAEAFAEKPIMISVPEIVKFLEHFIEKFEEVGVVEKLSGKSVSLKALSGKAFVCESDKLDKDILDRFRTELTKYLEKCCSNISQNGLFSDNTNLDISGLSELIELRNYLVKYTNSSKKICQKGYLYIMVQ